MLRSTFFLSVVTTSIRTYTKTVNKKKPTTVKVYVKVISELGTGVIVTN